MAALSNRAVTPAVLLPMLDNAVTLSSSATPARCAVTSSVGENADVKALASDLVLE